MICLDGADGAMLDQYSADGSLPNLAALRGKGAAKALSAPHGSTDDSLWASFQYALKLGEHGRYYELTPQSDDRLGMAHESEDWPTFWDDLSRQGMRVAVLDVPKCRRPRPLNGIHLVDWLTHGEYFESPQSYPPSLVEAVSRKYGVTPAHQCSYLDMEIDRREPDKTTADMLHKISMKRAAGMDYLQSADWDLFCIGISQMHCVNHKFWDLDSVPSIDALRSRNKPILEVLQSIDETVGAFVAAAGPAAECIVLAPTHFHRNGSWQHLMPEVISRINARLSKRFGRPLYLSWLLNLRIVRKLRKRLRRRDHEAWWGDPGTWPCTILPFSDDMLALRVAAAGQRKLFRDPSASLPRGELLDAVADELLALRGEAHGTESAMTISRPSSSQRGGCALNLPDVLAHYPAGHFPAAVHSRSIGRVEMRRTEWRRGNHKEGGFVIASGRNAARLIPQVQALSDLGRLVHDVLTAADAQPVAE